MKKLWAAPAIRRILLYRLADVSIIVTLLVASAAGFMNTKAARATAEQAQFLLANRPQILLRLSTAQGELRDRAHDLERIFKLVKNSQDIVVFIEDLETAAREQRIVLEFPVINEVPGLIESDQNVPLHGPFRAISLTISAYGEPEDLLQYIHDVEHGQHLVALSEWHINAKPAAVPVAISSALAVRESGEEAEPALSAASQLDATLILVVHNENYSF